MSDEIREACAALRNAGPARVADTIRGRRQDVWDLLLDFGIDIEPAEDGDFTLTGWQLTAGIRVVFTDHITPGLVQVLDRDGQVLRAYFRGPDQTWYEVGYSDEAHDPAR